MFTNVIIRQAKSEDINPMTELIALIFAAEDDFSVDATKQRRGLEMFLENPAGRCLLVAEHQQKVIGMCSAQLLVSTAEGGWKVLIEDVVVAEKYRKLGIGRQLLAKIQEWAVQQDAKRLDLLVDRNNSVGLSFYGKTNWITTNLIALQKKCI